MRVWTLLLCYTIFPFYLLFFLFYRVKSIMSRVKFYGVKKLTRTDDKDIQSDVNIFI